MSNFEKATRLKLRFNTNKGVLSTEQLWDLSLSSLSEIAKDINKQRSEISADGELDFLDNENNIDPILELQFEIVKSVYKTLREEKEQEKDRLANKKHNERIMELIYRKENEEMEKLSVDELKAQLKS